MAPAFFKNFLHLNPLIAFGIMLLAGLIGGHLAHLARYFPRIMGYIFIGLILGPHVSNIISITLINQSHVFEELAIGLILFELGLQLNLKTLWSRPFLLRTALIQCAAVFVFIFIGLILLNTDIIISAFAAALGVSISPAITLLIANEYGAKGQVINTSLILTALNNIIAFALYAIIVAIAQHTGSIDHSYSILIESLYPFYHMAGSIVLAAILALFMILIGKLVGKKENLQFTLLVGMLVIALGLANFFYFSPVLTMLALGVCAVNFDRKNDLMEVELGYMGEIFVVILFVSVGANLHIEYFFAAGKLVIAFIILRLLGSCIPLFLTKNKTGLTTRQSLSLGITLFPMAGTAIALLNITGKLANAFHHTLSLIILPAVAILEILGPMTTIFALRWAGELGKQQKLTH